MYTEPVPLKYGKPATKYRWIYGYFYSVAHRERVGAAESQLTVLCIWILYASGVKNIHQKAVTRGRTDQQFTKNSKQPKYYSHRYMHP